MMLSALDAEWRDKSPTVNCCRVQFMMYWHKFQMIFNGRFCVQCRQILAVAALRPVYTRCEPSFVPQTFSSFVFYPPSLSLCRRSARPSCTLSPPSSASWVDMPLTDDWLQVCFVLGPCFWKNTFPTSCAKDAKNMPILRMTHMMSSSDI